jgi:hypothetical protein
MSQFRLRTTFARPQLIKIVQSTQTARPITHVVDAQRTAGDPHPSGGRAVFAVTWGYGPGQA